MALPSIWQTGQQSTQQMPQLMGRSGGAPPSGDRSGGGPQLSPPGDRSGGGPPRLQMPPQGDRSGGGPPRLQMPPQGGLAGGGQRRDTWAERIAGPNYDPWKEGSLADPWEELKKRDRSGYDRWMNPEGDETLYRSLSERSGRASMGRRKSALSGLRARMGGNPSAYGLAAARADTQGQSDLSGELADARVSSVNSNNQFQQGMFDRWQRQRESQSSDRRSLWGRQLERESELAIYKQKAKIDKKNRPRQKILGIF